MSCTPTTKNNTTKTIRKDGSMRLTTSCKTRKGEPRTEQAHMKECDIKNIIRRYKQSGEPFPSSTQQGDIDVSQLPSYFEAQLTIAKGRSAFYAQPAAVRDRFGNDPHEFLEFFKNPENQEEAVKLGLAKRKAPTATPPAAPAAKSSQEAPSASKGSKKAPSGTPDGGQPKGGSNPPEAD